MSDAREKVLARLKQRAASQYRSDIGVRARQLLTLGRMGPTREFARANNPIYPPGEDLWEWFLRIDAEVNGEAWPRSGDGVDFIVSRPEHRHAVRPHLAGCHQFGDPDWFHLPGIPGWCYVARHYRRSGFQKRDEHRVWYTTLVSDIFASLTPMTSKPLDLAGVTEALGDVVDGLQIDPYVHYRDPTRAPWLVCKALPLVTEKLIEAYGSEYTTVTETRELWLEVLAAHYKQSKTNKYPKGARKSDALRLAWDSHSAINLRCEDIDTAADDGDTYADAVRAMSEDLIIYTKPTRKKRKKRSRK